jgi:capsule polysaccharide modification protein KpsS
MPKPNLWSRIAGWRNHLRVFRMARQVTAHIPKTSTAQPVIFFNASTRITGLSQNAAFTLLTSWALRLSGVSVRHFVCQSGMSHCVLGTNRDNYHKAPPCRACLRQSRRLYAGEEVYWFSYHTESDLATALKGLGVDELSNFEYNTVKGSLVTPGLSMPLGRLVIPSVRWALRRHTLPDDEETRYLLRQYILSAYNVAQEFSAFLDQTRPSAAVIFNGIMYPEATARWVAQARGLRVITYEVGFQRLSAFFTEGEATAYPIHIPKDFELTEQQDARLDEYLQKRFQGHFTMAGIRFWPEMRGLDQNFLNKAARFRQIVPVFTNVVYDTSQVHANKVFPHMFAWLDSVLELIRSHPETLFVIRAHPDEMRPGTAKQSKESVRDWVIAHGLKKIANVVFIDSQEYVSSYELIQRSKFVMVYNSSIGMEAVLQGVPVLCGGKARYTQYPMVFFPETPDAYLEMAQVFLSVEKIDVPSEFRRNARRFLYYQLFRSSLSFENYLQDVSRKGYVQLAPFTWQDLLPENSPTVQVLVDGIAGESLERQARLRSKEGTGEIPLFLTEDEA